MYFLKACSNDVCFFRVFCLTSTVRFENIDSFKIRLANSGQWRNKAQPQSVQFELDTHRNLVADFPYRQVGQEAVRAQPHLQRHQRSRAHQNGRLRNA